MANITNELAQIMKAVLGKDVRGSIHDAIYKINDVGEHQIDAGDLFKDGDSAAGYYDKSVYINTDTMTLLKSNGSVWVAQDTIKGETGNGIEKIEKTNVDVLTDEYTITYTDGTEQKYTVTNGKGIVQITKTTEGLKDTYTIKYNDNTEYTLELNNGRSIISVLKKSSDGSIDKYEIKYNDETTSEFEVTNGNKWYRGMNISGKAVNPTVYAGSGADGIKYARVDDYYMNPSEGSIYYCVREGDPEHAEWVYDFTLAGGGSGVSTWADLLNKPFTYVGNAGLDISGTSAADYTLKVKVDGSYISFDENGALTLASDIVSKLYKYYTGHFRTDDVTKMVYLADDVTKKLPNAVPTSAQKGYAPVVQDDGSVKWAKVSGGASYKLKVVGVIGSDYTITNLATSEETTGSFTTLDYVTIDVELGDNYNIVMTNGSETVQSGKVEIDGKEPIKTVTLSYFTAYVRVTMTIGASATLVNGSTTVNVPTSTQLQQTIAVPSKGVWRLTASLYEAEKYTDITITDSDRDKTKDADALLFALVNCQLESEFNNTLITISNGTETHSRTSDASGVIIFATANAGKFTISANYDGKPYSTSATMILDSTATAHLQTIPDGKTETPDVVNTWLHCAGVTDKDGMSLSQVASDGTLMNTLVQDSNANDYLVRSTSFATTLCASENAMTYLGMYDECANKLLDNDDWLTAICNSSNTEKILKDVVPTMLNNSSPKGNTFGSSKFSGTDYFYPFDASEDTIWKSSTDKAPQYIGYTFENPTNLKVLFVKAAINYGKVPLMKCELRASNDNFVSYDVIKLRDSSSEFDSPTLSEMTKFYYFKTDKQYQSFEVYINSISNPAESYPAFGRLQFYGRI